MTLQKKLKKKAAAQGDFAAKVMSFHILSIVTVLSHVLALWLSTKEACSPARMR